MAQNLEMVPEKRDYKVVNGSPVPSDRVLESSYLALTVPLGQWMYAEEGQGSLLHTLQGIKRGNNLEQQFAQYSNDAINRQVVKEGLANIVDTSNFEATRSGTSNIIKVNPTDVEQQDQFEFVSLSI